MQAKEQLDQIADAIWQLRLDRDPNLTRKQGLPVQHIPKGNLEEAEADQSFAKEKLNLVRQIQKEALPYEDQLTLDFMEDQLQWMARKTEIWWADFPVTPYTVYWLKTYAVDLFAPFVMKNKYDAELYYKLLIDFGDAIKAMTCKLEMQANKGWYLPLPALHPILAMLKNLKETLPLYLEVSERRTQALEPAWAKRWIHNVQHVVKTQVQQELQRLITYLASDDYRLKCPDRVGMGQYKGGLDTYQLYIRMNVSYDIAPEKIHDIGLEQVHLLTEQMREVRAQMKFHGSESDFLEHIREAGILYAQSPVEVEERYQYHMRRIEPLMKDYFLKLPVSEYSVKRLDPALEAGMTYGYFEAPSLLRSVGTYHYNGSGLETRPQLTAATLIYHELIPGHHLQVALQHENQQLHPIRRETLELIGYLEGWAEYGAGLPREMGLYDNPYDWYGRLVHERFISQRLVIDTGMNALGWSLQQARDYMKKTTIESDVQIASETLRYSTDLPAQALSYRLGYLKFMELRNRAQQGLGARFDIKQFHDAVLSTGPLPLSILEDHVKRFIQHKGELN
ncbi:DUF885 family protein [Ammoniphilus sp. CFH 90114]|uniref:DUF885 domain-containing protein n=1 Tax=Ammoniphilus sp. CFH 90114 TaxID=2493665 RepID=UPI00100DBAD1|nr:DUF885 domain-containing protein [Ammoniphilus sp. CFH 90114]RXT07074.1 DUF885 domain-containing protein [Ammoniphilus sp. CFH 90114]